MRRVRWARVLVRSCSLGVSCVCGSDGREGISRVTYQTALGAVFPRHRDKRRFVEPRFLVDQRLRKDLDSFQAGAERAYDWDDLLLTQHRCCEPVKRQPIRCWLESEETLVCCGRPDRSTNIGPYPQTTASHSEKGSFATAAAAGCEVGVVGVDGHAVDVARRLEVHQCLWLSGTGVEDTSGVP